MPDPVVKILHSLMRSLDGSEHQPQQVPYRLVPTVLMSLVTGSTETRNSNAHEKPTASRSTHVIAPQGLSLDDAATQFGVEAKYLSAVTEGREPVSAALAINLEKAGISTARTWLAMQ